MSLRATSNIDKEEVDYLSLETDEYSLKYTKDAEQYIPAIKYLNGILDENLTRYEREKLRLFSVKNK